MSQPIYPLYQPQVLQETCEGICRFDVRDQMLANRELELCGPIDAESAAILIRNLLYLQRADAVAPIKMFINSGAARFSPALRSTTSCRRSPAPSPPSAWAWPQAWRHWSLSLALGEKCFRTVAS